MEDERRTEPEEVKRMDITEFREKGFLQEVNRLFLHPLGLALEVQIDEDTGVETLGGIWDYRDDPEGLFFGGEPPSQSKASYVETLRRSKIAARQYAGADINGIQVTND